MSAPAYRSRNPFSADPITREEVRALRERLTIFWEDTMLVTDPNGHRIIQAGNLKAICDTLLAAMSQVEELSKRPADTCDCPVQCSCCGYVLQ